MKKGFCSILLCASLLTACGAEETVNRQIELRQEESEVTAYQLTPVVRGTVEQPLTIECRYSQTEEIELSFQVDDEVISQVYVEQGDTVKKGDLLISVDMEEMTGQVRDLTYQLEKARLALQQLQETRDFELEQADILYSYTSQAKEDENALKEQKASIEKAYADRLQDAEDTVYLTQRRLEEARQRLQQGAIYAPMDGVVSFVRSNIEGTLTEKNLKMVSIYDPDSCLFHSDNVEAIPYLDPNGQYTIVCGLGNAQREYTVEPVSIDAREEEIYFRLLGEEYDSGSTSTGRITIYTEKAEDVLCVDKRAIHTSEDNYYVYVLDGEGVRRMRFIELGIWGEDQVEVKSGLTEGEYVILK